jgi:hypothetical protein
VEGVYVIGSAVMKKRSDKNREVLRRSITEADVQKVVDVLKKMAAKGNLAAIREWVARLG